jgi:hypothetical protein
MFCFVCCLLTLPTVLSLFDGDFYWHLTTQNTVRRQFQFVNGLTRTERKPTEQCRENDALLETGKSLTCR